MTKTSWLCLDLQNNLLTARLYLARSSVLEPPCPSVCKCWAPEATKGPADTTEMTVTTGVTQIESDATWKGSICVEVGYKAARRESSGSRQARTAWKERSVWSCQGNAQKNQLIHQLWSDPHCNDSSKKNSFFKTLILDSQFFFWLFFFLNTCVYVYI